MSQPKRQIGRCPECDGVSEITRQGGRWFSICALCGRLPWVARFRASAPATRPK